MDITIEYRLSPDDIVQLMRISSTSSRPTGWKRARVLLPLIIIFGAIAFGYFRIIFASIPLLAAPGSRGDALIAMLPGTAVLLIVLLFLLRKPLLRAYFRRKFSRSPELSRRQILHITDAGIEFQNGDARSSLNWSRCIQFEELPELFLLYTAPREMHTIPKRAFPSSTQLDEFRAVARAHVSSQPKGFPVQPPR